MQSIKQIMAEYKKTKDFKKMSEEAKKLLEAQGLIKLPLGSYWRWMYIDWFNKALEEKVIAENEYGQFIPIADEIVLTETVREKGSINSKEVKKLGLSCFNNFAERYKKFCFAKEMEMKQLTLDEKMEQKG